MKSSEVLILWFPFTELHSCGVIKGDTPKAPLAFPSFLCFFSLLNDGLWDYTLKLEKGL